LPLQPPPPPNPFADNRELKYLQEQLKKCKDPPEKANLYLLYLAGCHFNPDLSPNTYIEFSEADVTNLLDSDESYTTAISCIR